MSHFSWTPLFSSILDSSVWETSKETRIVWIALLAKKDRNGFVRGTPKRLADHAGVTLEECKEALRVLSEPDLNSHFQEHEGRRIQEVPGGWVVLSHMYYRDMISKASQRSKQAAWQREYRKRLKKEERRAEMGGAREAIREGFESAQEPSGPAEPEQPKIPKSTATVMRHAKVLPTAVAAWVPPEEGSS